MFYVKGGPFDILVGGGGGLLFLTRFFQDF